MTDQKPTSQTLISREYQWGPNCEYDKLLNSIRWSGPNLDHNFYKCWSKKDKKAKEWLKEHKHDAYSNPARNVIEEQK